MHTVMPDPNSNRFAARTVVRAKKGLHAYSIRLALLMVAAAVDPGGETFNVLAGHTSKKVRDACTRKRAHLNAVGQACVNFGEALASFANNSHKPAPKARKPLDTSPEAVAKRSEAARKAAQAGAAKRAAAREAKAG